MLGLAPHTASRREDHGTDKKGRWTWAQLIGRSGKSILIIAAYRVSQTYPGEAGYSTAYMQQYRALLKENVSKPKPKHRVLIDLASFISNWRRHHENSSVIVMMDANADLTDPHLKTFISDTALHDVIRQHAPGLTNQHQKVALNWPGLYNYLLNSPIFINLSSIL